MNNIGLRRLFSSDVIQEIGRDFDLLRYHVSASSADWSKFRVFGVDPYCYAIDERSVEGSISSLGSCIHFDSESR
ncbi:hypothetical protein ACHAXS_000943 [Conticribra weissflogii]